MVRSPTLYQTTCLTLLGCFLLLVYIPGGSLLLPCPSNLLLQLSSLTSTFSIKHSLFTSRRFFFFLEQIICAIHVDFRRCSQI